MSTELAVFSAKQIFTLKYIITLGIDILHSQIKHSEIKKTWKLLYKKFIWL